MASHEMTKLREGLDRGIERRTLLKAGAWSVPVIAAVASAPAASASGDCVVSANGTRPVIATGSWSPSDTDLYSETGNAYTTGYMGNGGFQSYWNAADSTKDLTLTATWTVSVTKGAIYSFDFPVKTSPGNGNGGAQGSAPQSVIVSVDSTQVADIATRARNDSSQTSVEGSKIRVAWWDTYNGTVSSTYTATKTGSVTITAQFTLFKRDGAAQNGGTAQVNDDIILSPFVLTQTGCTAA